MLDVFANTLINKDSGMLEVFPNTLTRIQAC